MDWDNKRLYYSQTRIRNLTVIVCISLTNCINSEMLNTASITPGNSGAGPVLLLHGALPDHPSWWAANMAKAFNARGIEALSVPYSIFTINYLLNTGMNSPASRIGKFQFDLHLAHARTGCKNELKFYGVGFSAGTEVLLKSTYYGASYRRLYFAGSPISAWNEDLKVALHYKIGSLINYYSPLDLLVWLKGGAGAFGFHNHPCVDNRIHPWPHWTVIWRSNHYINSVVDEIANDALMAHTCWNDQVYIKSYHNAVMRLLGNSNGQ